MASDSVVGVNVISGRAMAEADIRWPYCEFLGSVPGQLSPCGIHGGQSSNGTYFSQNTSVLPYHYHSISAPLLANWQCHKIKERSIGITCNGGLCILNIHCWYM
jgi:hypothetical protein